MRVPSVVEEVVVDPVGGTVAGRDPGDRFQFLVAWDGLLDLGIREPILTDPRTVNELSSADEVVVRDDRLIVDGEVKGRVSESLPEDILVDLELVDPVVVSVPPMMVFDGIRDCGEFYDEVTVRVEEDGTVRFRTGGYEVRVEVSSEGDVIEGDADREAEFYVSVLDGLAVLARGCDVVSLSLDERGLLKAEGHSFNQGYSFEYWAAPKE